MFPLAGLARLGKCPYTCTLACKTLDDQVLSKSVSMLLAFACFAWANPTIPLMFLKAIEAGLRHEVSLRFKANA